jgi:hypothetical protein
MDKYDEKRMVEELYKKGKMPCCGGTQFVEGPSGGLSINIKCVDCGEWFNICPSMKLIEKISDKGREPAIPKKLDI